MIHYGLIGAIVGSIGGLVFVSSIKSDAPYILVIIYYIVIVMIALGIAGHCKMIEEKDDEN